MKKAMSGGGAREAHRKSEVPDVLVHTVNSKVVFCSQASCVRQHVLADVHAERFEAGLGHLEAVLCRAAAELCKGLGLRSPQFLVHVK